MPNFGHWYPRLRTVLGIFDYDQRGILDKTHVRFFTRRSLLRMIKKNGFDVKRMEMTGLPVDVVSGERSLDQAAGARASTRCSCRLRPTMFAYQFVVEVEPVPPPRSTVWSRRTLLSATAPAAEPQGGHAGEPGSSRQLPRACSSVSRPGAAALLIALSRHVFLFWDDFYFLGQARESDLTWGYLTDPLFQHFSPVVRLFNIAVADAIPHHPWVVPLVLFVLLASA